MRNGFLLVCIVICLSSCAPAWQKHITEYSFNASNNNSISPDYSSLQFWAAHPLKHDTSDSIPRFLKKRFTTDTTADVFFIYPTTYTDQTLPYGWNAPILQSSINAKTDYSTILYQASIFNFTNRVFSPRYRQANLKAYYTKDTANALKALMLAYADVKKAFAYYLKYENKGRPIIIAAHSQGTTHAKWLLRDFFDGKPLQQKLVAAYLVGVAVEPTWFSHIPACAMPEQTGCFCSWRTYREDYKPDFVKNEKFTAVVTNPLTWDNSQPTAARSKNMGGVLLKFNKKVRHVTDATVHEGVLWVKRPHFFGSILLHQKNYHIGDYNLFYMNVRQNAKQRLLAWKSKDK